MNGADHTFILAPLCRISPTVRDPRGGAQSGKQHQLAVRATGKVSCTAACYQSSFSVLIPLASLVLHLLRPLQALKTTPTAVPLTATATVLQAARAGTHHPDPQHKAVTFQRHLPPTSPPARPPVQPALLQHNQITLGTLIFFFFPFPKIKLCVSCSGCTSHSSLTFLGPLPARPQTVEE